MSTNSYIQCRGFWYGSRNGCYASLGRSVVVVGGDAAIPPRDAADSELEFVRWADAPSEVRDALEPAYEGGDS